MARMLGAQARHHVAACGNRHCQWCGLTASEVQAYRPVQRRRENRAWREAILDELVQQAADCGLYETTAEPATRG